VPPEGLRAVFKADVGKLPVHVGMGFPGNGYALYRISSVKPGEGGKEDQRGRALAQQYTRLVAEEEFAAWMATVKERYPVTINKAVLESKER
jgi:peptidyl-prolyl cis-trans isomerase D